MCLKCKVAIIVSKSDSEGDPHNVLLITMVPTRMQRNETYECMGIKKKPIYDMFHCLHVNNGKFLQT